MIAQQGSFATAFHFLKKKAIFSRVCRATSDYLASLYRAGQGCPVFCVRKLERRHVEKDRALSQPPAGFPNDIAATGWP